MVRKLNVVKTFKIFIVIMLFIGSSLAVINTTQLAQNLSAKAQLPTEWPSVYFTNGTAYSYNENESFIGNVKDTITIALVVTNLTNNLYYDPANPLIAYPLGNLNGFDVQMSWDPTILHLLDYTVTVPVETYPDPVSPSPYAGLLHEEIFELKNKTDENGNIPGAETSDTLAWFSYAIMPGAEVFNGNGTFFTMTFNVTKSGACSLKLTKVDLSGDGGTVKVVKCHKFDGEFRTADAPKASFTFWPDIGVIDKPVIFNASNSYSPIGGVSISDYVWDFDDGNVTTVHDPIIDHSYNHTGSYTVSLIVEDSNGIRSSPKTAQVSVVNKRNVKIAGVLSSAKVILVNRTIDITVRVEDDGDTDENCTLGVYYNASLVDWADISTTNWTKIGGSNVSLLHGGFSIKIISWNTTGVPEPDGIYYVLANVTTVPYENVNDNNMTSDAIVIRSTPLHDVVVENLQVGWSTAFKSPVLDGENTTFQIAVLNNGTENETAVHVTLYSDDSTLESWNASIPFGKTVQLTFEESFDPGYYNITAQATIEVDAYPDDNLLNATLHVIKLPKVSFTVDPETPSVNQTVTLDASATYHQESGASITEYLWQIYDPSGTVVNTTYGADLTSITYKFGQEGNWRVSLSVKDSYNIEYKHERPASSVYQTEKTITVKTGGAGFPIEYIVAIIIIVVAVVAVLEIVIRRRRQRVKT